MTRRRRSSGNRFDVPFHAALCFAWLVVAVVRMTTNLPSLVVIAAGAALGVAAHGLSVAYGLWSMREMDDVYRRALAERDEHAARVGTLVSEVETLNAEASVHRARIADLEKNQRPTRRDPGTGRYTSA